MIDRTEKIEALVLAILRAPTLEDATPLLHLLMDVLHATEINRKKHK